jgi:hypothetical protein
LRLLPKQRTVKVMIPTAPARFARSTGSTLMAPSQSPNLRTVSEAIARKRDPGDAGGRDHGGAGKLKSCRGKRIDYPFAADIAGRQQRPWVGPARAASMMVSFQGVRLPRQTPLATIDWISEACGSAGLSLRLGVDAAGAGESRTLLLSNHLTYFTDRTRGV